jgi:hypothetical protein
LKFLPGERLVVDDEGGEGYSHDVMLRRAGRGRHGTR